MTTIRSLWRIGVRPWPIFSTNMVRASQYRVRCARSLNNTTSPQAQAAVKVKEEEDGSKPDIAGSSKSEAVKSLEFDVKEFSRIIDDPKATERIPKTGPYVGRSIPVQNNDIGRAMRRLDLVLRLNQVRKMAREQKYHEKPSRKRKRLRSESSRKRFNEGIKRLVTLVHQMKSKGL